MTSEHPQPSQLITACKGEGFRNSDGSDRQDAIRSLNPGDWVQLIREPTNIRDPNAVALMTNWGGQIGYLNRDIAKIVAPLMDADLTVHGVVERVQCRTRPGSPLIALLRLTLPPKSA
jgi:hypothetical protein